MARSSNRARRPLAEFLHEEAAGGVVLVLATIAALLWVNLSPSSYGDLWSWKAGTDSLFGLHFRLDLHAWVNDALMALFFFVVGLEIKRELVVGELASPRAAAMPVIAALGGMVAPALIYLALNSGAGAAKGWAIPMATDIAFVIGVLSLLGSRVPRGLRLFLLSVAIVDDLAAIAVIAIFYSSGVDIWWLAAAAGAVVSVMLMRRFSVSTPALYGIPAVFLWICVHESGVHATIAGVLMGLLTPAHPIENRYILAELEQRMHPLTSFAVVPLFALANAGVQIDGEALRQVVSSPVSWGIVCGLVVGKGAGISLAALAARRARIATLPPGVEVGHLVGAAILGGIGFTVALLIADLSFGATAFLVEAKLAILLASLVAAALGSLVLMSVPRRAKRDAAATTPWRT